MEERKGGAFVSPILLYGAAFVLPAGIMLAILYQGGFYPFGGKTLFIMDMRDQYLEFLAYLRNVTSGGNSVFFCWSRSMGGNFLGLFAYYLASPLSFLVNLFPVEKMPEAILLLTVLKIGLCGLSFAVYGNAQRKRFGSGKGGRRETLDAKSVFMILIFSVSYALLSYNMVYSLCLMWLDGVILLPVVLLGTEKILDGGKGFPYMVSLAGLFLCNYYIGYMAGLFTGMYFLYRAVCRGKEHGGKGSILAAVRFGICTILAVGLSAPLLLPSVRDLMQGKLAGESGYAFTLERGLDLRSFLGKLQSGVYDSITDTGLPSIYCGVVVLAFAVLFFACRGISLREKAGALLILGILTGSFLFKSINLIWHGFQAPVWFPYRYAFVFSFFLIYMGFRAACAFGLGKPGERMPRVFRGLCASGLRKGLEPGERMPRVFRGLCVSGLRKGLEPGERMPCTSGLGKDTGKTAKRAGMGKRIGECAVLTGLLVLAAFDLKGNGQALLAGLDGEFGYVTAEEYQAVLERTKGLAEGIQARDEDLYRINAVYEYSKNDAMLFGYHGMTHYSSTYNANVNELTRKLGIAQAHIWNSGYGSTPLTDSLFAVRYRLSEGYEPAVYEKIGDEGKGAAAYRNPLALPMVYAANGSEDSEREPAFGGDPYLNQNAFLNGIAGKEKTYFRELEYEYTENEDGWDYVFAAPSSEPLYLYMYPASNGWADIYVNGVKYGNYFTTESTCSVYIGSYEPGQQVTVRVERVWRNPAAYGAVIAELDTEALRETLEELQAGGMEIEDFQGGKIRGRIRLQEGQRIMTSIPYDEGWSVRVDGRKADTGKFAGTFLTVEASAGEHEILFTYVSPGFYEGAVIFLLSAAGAGVYFHGGRKRRFPAKALSGSLTEGRQTEKP